MLNDEQKIFIAKEVRERINGVISFDRIKDTGSPIRLRDMSKREWNSDCFLIVYPYKTRLFFIAGTWRDRSLDFKYLEGTESRKLTSMEKRQIDIAIKKAMDEEERKNQKNLKEKIELFGTLPFIDDVNPDFLYLKKKGLSRTYIGRYDKDRDRLIFPLMGADGKTHGLQNIPPDGINKRFEKGTHTTGLFYPIYDHTSRTDSIFACEGFATGLSIFEATNTMTVVCLNCGNLTEGIKGATEYLLHEWRKVIKETPKQFYRRFTIVSDNDEKKGGENGAIKACSELGCSYVLIPNYGDKKLTDANDYMCKFGLNSLSKLLNI